MYKHLDFLTILSELYHLTVRWKFTHNSIKSLPHHASAACSLTFDLALAAGPPHKNMHTVICKVIYVLL